MGEQATESNFFFRARMNCYHTLVPRSEVIVFHEATQGPFRKSETVFADWSPDDSDIEKISNFHTELDTDIDQYLKKSSI